MTTYKMKDGERVPFSAEEEAQKAADIAEKNSPERKWAKIRADRDQLLKDSDFTQLEDSPKNKLAWKTYRKALRDITDQPDPDNITWPVAPE